jgi:hypothetical protein
MPYAAVNGPSDGGIVGLDMAMNHPHQRVAGLVASGANARVDGYTQDSQGFLRSFDPAAEPVWDDICSVLPTGRRLAGRSRTHETDVGQRAQLHERSAAHHHGAHTPDHR